MIERDFTFRVKKIMRAEVFDPVALRQWAGSPWFVRWEDVHAWREKTRMEKDLEFRPLGYPINWFTRRTPTYSHTKYWPSCVENDCMNIEGRLVPREHLRMAVEDLLEWHETGRPPSFWEAFPIGEIPKAYIDLSGRKKRNPRK